jgi:hypothetical protein
VATNFINCRRNTEDRALKNKTGIKDFLWFSIIAIAIMAFSSIPYWAAHFAETSELRFRGIYFDEMDYSVHISMMQAGRMGDWAYQMRFTSEAHQPAFLRMFYIILGHISKWINLAVETTFHLARWVFGFFALYAIYQLCRKIFPNLNQARAAFLLAALGAGVGWLQLILGAPLTPISPIDLWLIDAYVFFSISLFPSYSFTLVLMTSALNLYLDFLTTGKWRIIVFIGLFAIASQITNPIAFAVIDIAFIGATFILWWKNKKIELGHLYALCMIALMQIPLLIYNFLILRHNPIWSQYTVQHQTFSPPPIFYIWGFAPFWAFAIYGMILAFREKNPNITALSAWVISGFILAYLPLITQRRFLLGITIPLGIVAIYGLNHFIKQISIKIPAILKREQLIYFAYILFSSISSISLSLGSSLYLQTHPDNNFYPRDLMNAFVWLDENATPNDFVLADIRTSQLAAQQTRLKLYLGHEMETINFADKMSNMEAFYNGSAPSGWLQQTPIHWVVFSQYEKEVASSFIPGPDLELVYQNKTVRIYKAKR